jgi:HD superfamily phosphohydrolase YqeK
MRNIKLFEREINLIVDEGLRMAVKSYMDEATPDYFWTDGASSSGKYHPQFSQGLGGLVRHTKAVVMFAEELLRMSSYAYMKDEYKDFVIAACILHDSAKYGIEGFDKSEYKNHAKNASKAFADWCAHNTDYEPHFLLLNAIESHMGQWSTDKEDRPFTSVDRCVHMADYMASRSFIDIPSITEEWSEIACQWAAENHELPF